MRRAVLILALLSFLLTGCVMLRPIEDPPPKAEAANPEPEEPSPYSGILEQYFTALTKQKDYPSFGVQEAVMGLSPEEALDSIGYTVRDVSGDGIPELVIGRTSPKEYAGTMIYGVYTAGNGEPELIFGGWERSRYYPKPDGTIFYRGSGGSMYTLFGIYALSEDGTALICRDYWFSHEKNPTRTVVGYYHNTTGERNPSLSEELNISNEEYRQIEEELSSDLVTWELTPFSDYPPAEAADQSDT